MSRKARLLLAFLAGAALLVVSGVLLLPRFLDVNRYRDVIESRAGEALGRPVRLGELDLSLVPVLGLRVDDLAIGALPEEGKGDLLTAERLRIGARLWPLLRGRLEVRSVLLREPVVRLERDADGSWNLARLIAREQEPAAGRAEGERRTELSVARLRVTGGRVHLTDALPSPTDPVEIALTDLEIDLEDFARGRSFPFVVAGRFAEAPEARLRFAGEAGPLGDVEEPPRLSADVELRELPPPLLARLARLGGLELEPLLGERAATISARIDAGFGDAPSIELSDAVLEHLDLRVVRSRAGVWNLPPRTLPTGRETDAGPSAARSKLRLRDLRLREGRVRLALARKGREPATASIAGLDVRLRGMPSQSAAEVSASAELEAGGETGRIEAEGSVGPLAGDRGVPLDLAITAEGLSVAWLHDLLGGRGGVSGAQGRARLDVRADGTLPAELRLRGGVSLGRVEATIATTGGAPRQVAMEIGARFEIHSEDAGEVLRFPTLELAVDGRPLRLEGSLATTEAGRRLDLTLHPANLPAESLVGLAAMLYPQLGVSASSAQPVEISARIRGLLAEGSAPEVDGRLRVADLRLAHPSLGRPIDSLTADVRFAPERLEASDLRAVVGSSDLAGELSIEGLGEPRVSFELRSDRMRFDEVLALLGGRDGGRRAGRAGDSQEGLLERVRASGSIAIDSGSWGGLDFTELSSSLTLEDGLLTLDPVESSLYDGAFAGRATVDLRRSAPPFSLDGEARRIRVESFLAETLAVQDRLAGRFSGEVRAQGDLGDFESLLRSLEGRGAVTLEEGRVEGFRLLRAVADVAGVFGQRTLARIAGRLADASTGFETLRGTFRIDDGRLLLDDVVLDSADYALSGDGEVDLLDLEIRGDAVMAFSPALSELMRGEDGSRAGDLFWNADTGRVTLPFTLRGGLEDPKVSVDWGQAARSLAEGRIERELRGVLEEALGREREAPTPTPAPQARPEPSGELGAVVTLTRWRGLILAQDLEIEGTVSGARLARASARLVDAAGRELGRVEPLPELETHLATSLEPRAPATIDWRVRFDGKRLLLARFPLTVEVSVEDANGRTTVVSEAIEK